MTAQIRLRHWVWAVGLAVALHAAAALAVLWEPPPSGARAAGAGGLEVSLGPAGGAPGSAAVDTPPPTEAKPADAADAVTPPPADAVPHRPSPPEEVQKPAPSPADAVPVATAVAPEEKTVREAKVRPVEPPLPRAKPPVPKEVRKPAPDPVQEAEPPPEIAVAERLPDRQDVQPRTAKPSVAGTEGKAGPKSARLTGSGNETSGGGRAGSAADYVALLQAWLEKHKEYPRSARSRRIEGTVMLYFVIGKRGKVFTHRIETTSGHRVLDNEARAMIERANPVPPIPDSMNRERVEIVVPVQFFLR